MKQQLLTGMALSLGFLFSAFVGCGGESNEPQTTTGKGGSGTGGFPAFGGSPGSGGSSIAGAGGSSTGGKGGSAGVGGTAGSAGTAGTAGDPEPNDDCASATDFGDYTEAAEGVIDPPGDVDHYQFTVETGGYVAPGSFIFLYTDANPEDLPDKLDTVVSLYSEDGTTLVATADDSVPRFTTDSELWYHIPADFPSGQKICVRVEDYSSWMGEEANGGPSFSYKLFISVPADDAVGNNADTEPNNDGAHAQPLTYYDLEESNAKWGLVYGMVDPVDDVDVYRLTMPVETKAAEIYFSPSGPGGVGEYGSGSTTDLGLVNLTDLSGDIIAQLDVTKGSQSLSVPLDAGTQALVVLQRPAGRPLGLNDFYNLRFNIYDEENPRETETTTGENDSVVDAEVLVLNPDPELTEFQRAYLLGFLPQVDDVDYWRFVANAGDKVALSCTSIRAGSGLLGVTYAIRNVSDTTLQEETETEDADVYWNDDPYLDPSMGAVAIPADGTYLVRVHASGQKSDVSSNFYRCGVHVQTPGS